MSTRYRYPKQFTHAQARDFIRLVFRRILERPCEGDLTRNDWFTLAPDGEAEPIMAVAALTEGWGRCRPAE